MRKRKIFFRIIGISLVAAFSLTSCQAAATSLAPASPTSAPPASPNPVVPTATATAATAATEPPAPAATATPAATVTAAPAAPLTAQVIPAMNAYCRKGPGTGYYEITFLQKGTAYVVLGRNSNNTWWLVLAPGNVNCWMGDPNASQQGPVEQAKVVLVPPLPVTPSSFTSSYACNSTLHSLKVTFAWTAVDNVTGYRIYRNGNLLVEVGPNVAAYVDYGPLKLKLVYELEAFNDYGMAAHLSTTVPACD